MKRGPGILAASTRLLAAVLGLLAGITAANSGPPPADSRQVFGPGSPAWLRAVGKLQVPGHKYRDGRRAHHREDCSATLVARPASTRADTIVTAWHCLEFYRDLSKPIAFTLMPGSELHSTREAYRLADGGGMHADWAILRLYEAVSLRDIPAIRVHPERADADRTIAMAGYSRDSGLGNYGEQLTFDPDCAITHQSRFRSDSDCTAHKGSSGGAVIQLSALGEPRLCGVISQGDSARLSTFVPVSGFRNAINQYLK